jgi:hypothetical protein
MTPQTVQEPASDCHIVGNKFYNLINEESHHSKWEEFRQMAKQVSATEECSSLLSRMELEVSDEEVEHSEKGSLEEDDEMCPAYKRKGS